MELKEFVKETLNQIVEATQESQLKVRNIGGYVNPVINIRKSPQQSQDALINDDHNIYTVDFNIAVSVSQKSDKKITVVSPFNHKGGVACYETNTSLSKIAFKIPLALPVDPTSKKEGVKPKNAHKKKAKN